MSSYDEEKTHSAEYERATTALREHEDMQDLLLERLQRLEQIANASSAVPRTRG